MSENDSLRYYVLCLTDAVWHSNAEYEILHMLFCYVGFHILYITDLFHMLLSG